MGGWFQSRRLVGLRLGRCWRLGIRLAVEGRLVPHRLGFRCWRLGGCGGLTGGCLRPWLVGCRVSGRLCLGRRWCWWLVLGDRFRLADGRLLPPRLGFRRRRLGGRRLVGRCLGDAGSRLRLGYGHRRLRRPVGRCGLGGRSRRRPRFMRRGAVARAGSVIHGGLPRGRGAEIVHIVRHRPREGSPFGRCLPSVLVARCRRNRKLPRLSDREPRAEGRVQRILDVVRREYLGGAGHADLAVRRNRLVRRQVANARGVETGVAIGFSHGRHRCRETEVPDQVRVERGRAGGGQVCDAQRQVGADAEKYSQLYPGNSCSQDRDADVVCLAFAA
jgi:hypothetical protein